MTINDQAKTAIQNATLSGMVDLTGFSGTPVWDAPVLIDRPIVLQLPARDLYFKAEPFEYTPEGRLRLMGHGRNYTMLFPTTTFNGQALLPLRTPQAMCSIRGLTCWMSDAPRLTAIELSSRAYVPTIEDVHIAYPKPDGTPGPDGTPPPWATGTAISLSDTQGAFVRDCFIQNPGTGVFLDGDMGAQHRIISVQVENAGTGVLLSRITADDNGGLYLDDVDCNNPGQRKASRAYMFDSLVPHAAPPIFMRGCTGDNSKNLPVLSVRQIDHVNVSDCWFQNGDNSPAVSLENTSAFHITGSEVSSGGHTFEFRGRNDSLLISHCQLSGGTEFFFMPEASLWFSQISDNRATYSTNDVAKLATAYRTSVQFNGNNTPLIRLPDGSLAALQLKR